MPVDSTRTPASLTLVIALVAARLALPLVTLDAAWGIHRDEFLYFAMGDHLDPFRMQFPPMMAAIAATGHALFGESVFAARVPAALGGAALTAIVLCTVRRLGGGTIACVFAWLSLLAAPLFLRASLLMQPVIFDQVFAALAIAALTLAAHERAPRWWLVVGLGLGLGALNKFSIAFVGTAIAAATLLDATLRSHLRTRWPWLAVLIGACLSVPCVSGQVVHGWPFLQQMQSLRSAQLERVTAAEFLGGQFMMLAGGAVCVVAGVLASVRGGARDRVPVIVATCIVLLMLVLHGKAYYAGPAYPVVIGVGALALERVLHTRRVATTVAMLALAATAGVLWPIGVPSIGPAAMMRYAAALGIAEAVRTNQGVTLALPQDYADMLGWREMADAAGDVVSRLPAAERADLTLVGGNYGQAGALAFYRNRARLPYAVSTAGDFWAWGPGTASGNDAIVVAGEDAADDLARLFTRVDVVRTLVNPLRVPEEQRVLVYHARGARTPLARIWPKVGPIWR